MNRVCALIFVEFVICILSGVLFTSNNAYGYCVFGVLCMPLCHHQHVKYIFERVRDKYTKHIFELNRVYRLFY